MGYVVGLTGLIGSGKSRVAMMSYQLGIGISSADYISHTLMETDEIKNLIRNEFGELVFDEKGKVDRRVLGKIVFEIPKAKKSIEDIMHCRIIEALEKEIEKFRTYSSDSDILLVEIPLLTQCGLEYLVDAVLIVTADVDIRINRVRARDGRSLEEAVAIVNQQIQPKAPDNKPCYVISNDGSFDDLFESMEKVLKLIKENLNAKKTS
jgi:dephospho-CoA kinase